MKTAGLFIVSLLLAAGLTAQPANPDIAGRWTGVADTTDEAGTKRQETQTLPGACGHNGWHTIRTMLRFSVNAGKISNVEAIELGPRGRKAAAVTSG